MLKESLLPGLVLLLSLNAFASEKNQSQDVSRFWREGKYCRQENIDLKKIGQGTIRAQVEGKWQDFTVQHLSPAFMEWNLKGRIKSLEGIKKGEMPGFAGPHSGMVASHGFRRSDSRMTINNAVKGMGFLPQAEFIGGLREELKSSADSSMDFKLNWLSALYSARKDLLDDTKQVSLELYAKPDHVTHTFLNQMTDPAVSIVFLDIPSYEVRAITQLIDPRDPELTEYQRQTADYVNGIHDYFHGAAPRQSIVAVYHVIEVFDNTPGRAKGKRVVPPLP
ncbi:MAG: hypothetical protein Q8O74_03580 [bacterium]|nr:hypothetical protein [bacterium]